MENDNRTIFAQVLSKAKEEKIREMFYGGLDSAEAILLVLKQYLVGNIPLDEDLAQFLIYFYTQVWVRKHGGLSPEFSSNEYICQSMLQRFDKIPEQSVVNGTIVCIQYIEEHEPGINSNNVSLMRDRICLVNFEQEYMDSYEKGVELFELGKLPEAIEAYQKCIDIKEDDVLARFEIAEAYIGLKDLDASKNMLLELVNFVRENTDRARLLRRLGFIEIENGNFELATALFLYSIQFDKNKKAFDELEYIQSVTKKRIEVNYETAVKPLIENNMLFWRVQ